MCLARRTRQSLVEEHRRRREDHAAIDIVLHLLDGCVADPHGAIAMVTLEIGNDALGESVGWNNAIDVTQTFLAIGCDAERVVGEMFHRTCRADAVQSLDDEVGVAQPAIAIIPVSPGAGRLGDRCR